MLKVFAEDGKVVRLWPPLWIEMRRSVVSISGKDAYGVEIMSCWKSHRTQITPVRRGGEDKLVSGAGLLYGIL